MINLIFQRKLENRYFRINQLSLLYSPVFTYRVYNMCSIVQIELVHAQFTRGKGRRDSPDMLLEMDLSFVQKEKNPDPAILERLSEKLHLRNINDLKKESLAIHDMVLSCDGDPGDCYQMMLSLFQKLKDFVLIMNPDAKTSEVEKGLIKHRSPVIPDDFRCPISLELMKDPVIVSTGQVYT